MGWPSNEQKAFLDRLIEEKVRTKKQYGQVVDFLDRLSQSVEDTTAPSGGAKEEKKGGLLTTYDQSVGLIPLIERAVGPGNYKNIHRAITQERFPLRVKDVQRVYPRVEPYRVRETSEEAVRRLVAAGYTLANTGDLAGYMFDHPDEMGQWMWVLAISEDSRWSASDGRVYVPFGRVFGLLRHFNLTVFRNQLLSSCGVLVLSESPGT